ncbi:MAG: HipA domain-containing protein, partial [Sphingomonas sp.]|uniref:type II toxin-antitoxin system HipA family toxin n=1 Tax=Sphingomonas sp. TaxID=28214 RepID=UPI00258A9F01
AASHSYEQAIQVIRRLDLPRRDLDQQVLRAFFNVLGRNCDDHVKNIAFLMNRRGEWRLAPAYDISYAWNPDGEWTQRPQMSLNGKRDGFERDDLIAFAETAGIKRARAERMLDRVIEALRRWPAFAVEAGVAEARIDEIQAAQIQDP